jgi:hypothetical protein
VRLEQTPAIAFHVTDSVTGAAVDANVAVRDPSGSFRVEATRIESGLLKAWLKGGTYSAFVFARGYVSKSQSFTAPGDVSIAIVHAGTLLIRARTAQRARLELPGGPPQRGLGMLHPGPNGPYESLAPGSYVLTLIGSDGKVTQSIAVVIISGQTTTIDTP